MAGVVDNRRIIENFDVHYPSSVTARAFVSIGGYESRSTKMRRHVCKREITILSLPLVLFDEIVGTESGLVNGDNSTGTHLRSFDCYYFLLRFLSAERFLSFKKSDEKARSLLSGVSCVVSTWKSNIFVAYLHTDFVGQMN